jgi:hypothetical protein
MGNAFGASLIRYPLRPAILLAALADLTGLSPSQPRLLHPSFQAGRSPFPLSSITTVATEQAPPAGLAPTGRQLASLHYVIHFTAAPSFGEAQNTIRENRAGLVQWQNRRFSSFL